MELSWLNLVYFKKNLSNTSLRSLFQSSNYCFQAVYRDFKRHRFKRCNIITHLFRPFKYPWMSWLGEIWGFNQTWLDYSSLQVERWQGSNFHSLDTFPHTHTHTHTHTRTHTHTLPAVVNNKHQGAAVSAVWGPLTSDPLQAVGEENKNWLAVRATSPVALTEERRVGGGSKQRAEEEEQKATEGRKKAAGQQKRETRHISTGLEIKYICSNGRKPTLSQYYQKHKSLYILCCSNTNTVAW